MSNPCGATFEATNEDASEIRAQPMRLLECQCLSQLLPDPLRAAASAWQASSSSELPRHQRRAITRLQIDCKCRGSFLSCGLMILIDL